MISGIGKLALLHNNGFGDATYDPDYFPLLYQVEDRHFWFKARNRVIAAVVRQAMSDRRPGYRILEIGCGTANVLRVLEQTCPRGMIVGMDLFAEGLRIARRRTAGPLVQADMYASPFATQFDLIGLFDVLEHLPDDLEVLKQLHSMLAPDGVLVVTVPAHASLWSSFDEASHHCRRYEMEDLSAKLLQAGFQLNYLSYYMAAIYLPMWVRRKFSLLVPRARISSTPSSAELVAKELSVIPLFNDLITWLLSLEIPLIVRQRRIPIGTSMLAVARKTLGT